MQHIEQWDLTMVSNTTLFDFTFLCIIILRFRFRTAWLKIHYDYIPETDPESNMAHNFLFIQDMCTKIEH